MNEHYFPIYRERYIHIHQHWVVTEQKYKNMSIAHRFPKLGFIENSIFIQGSVWTVFTVFLVFSIENININSHNFWQIQIY